MVGQEPVERDSPERLAGYPCLGFTHHLVDDEPALNLGPAILNLDREGEAFAGGEPARVAGDIAGAEVHHLAAALVADLRAAGNKRLLLFPCENPGRESIVAKRFGAELLLAGQRLASGLVARHTEPRPRESEAIFRGPRRHGEAVRLP